KIEFSRRSDISFSSSIVDSLCGSDDDDSKPEGRGSVNFKSRSDKVADSVTNGNFLLEMDRVHSLQKSLSAKVEVSNLISPLENDYLSKVQFNPVKKRMNNFKKSRSL
ncbi:hypothetical protein KIW84_075115, partial [Lathyrus oleraceus]